MLWKRSCRVVVAGRRDGGGELGHHLPVRKPQQRHGGDVEWVGLAEEVGGWRVGFPPEDHCWSRLAWMVCGVVEFDLCWYLQLGGDDSALVIDSNEGAEDDVEGEPGGPEPFSTLWRGWCADAGQEEWDAGEEEAWFLMREDAQQGCSGYGGEEARI